jgi:hypothetical protein
MLAVVARARDFSLEMIDSRKLSGFSTTGGLQQVHNIVRLSFFEILNPKKSSFSAVTGH